MGSDVYVPFQEVRVPTIFTEITTPPILHTHVLHVCEHVFILVVPPAAELLLFNLGRKTSEEHPQLSVMYRIACCHSISVVSLSYGSWGPSAQYYLPQWAQTAS